MKKDYHINFIQFIHIFNVILVAHLFGPVLQQSDGCFWKKGAYHQVLRTPNSHLKTTLTKKSLILTL